MTKGSALLLSGVRPDLPRAINAIKPDHSSVVNLQHVRGINDRRPAVRHHHHGPSAGKFAECRHQTHLGDGIHAGRRFVQDHQSSVSDERPRQPQQLCFTGREASVVRGVSVDIPPELGPRPPTRRRKAS